MYHKKWILVVLLALIFSVSNHLFSRADSARELRSVIVEADGYVFLSEDKTIRQIRNEARMEAQRAALEKVGTHIKSITTVENYRLIRDQIMSQAAGMLKTIESKDNGFTADNRYHYWIKAEVSYVLPAAPPEPQPPGRQNKLNEGPLTVKIWSQQAQYKANEPMQFFMQGNKDFYARVIYVDAKGNRLQLVPNQFDENNFFKGGETIKIPSGKNNYQLTVSPPYGQEKVIVYASTSPLGEIDTTPAGNSFLQVESDLENIEVKSRGVTIEKKDSGAEFFETNCQIKTGK